MGALGAFCFFDKTNSEQKKPGITPALNVQNVALFLTKKEV